MRTWIAFRLRRLADRIEHAKYVELQVAFPRTGYVTVKRSPYRKQPDYLGIVPLSVADGTMHGHMPYGRWDDTSETLLAAMQQSG